MQEKAIEPIGESKSDFEIVGEIAKKLGKYEEVTEGKTVEDLEKSVFESTGYETSLSAGKSSKKRNISSSPLPRIGRKIPRALRKFYEDPEKNPLPTPSGKLEFYSERLAKNFPG